MTKKLRLLIDKSGSLEILGLSRGELEARKLSRDLGFPDFYAVDPLCSAVRADGLTAEALEEIAKKAEAAGIEVQRVEKLAPAKKPKAETAEEVGSTVGVIHQHSLSVSRKEKVLVPIVLLVVGAILVGVGTVVRDHLHHEYTLLRDVGAVVAQAGLEGEAASGAGGILNPSDERYVAFGVRGWQFWVGRSAITQGHYIRTPDLAAPTIESLVKAERGAAALVFRIDLGKSEGHRFHVDAILRGGLQTEEPPQMFDIYPLTLGERPVVGASGYREATGISHDRTDSFRGVERFAALGRLEVKDGSLRLVSDKFNVVLSDEMDSGLRSVLEDIAKEQPKARLTLFLDLKEVYPWSVDGRPGRRQTEREIGLARMDGLQLGKIFLANGAPAGEKAPA
jgi:hypothetical protein